MLLRGGTFTGSSVKGNRVYQELASAQMRVDNTHAAIKQNNQKLRRPRACPETGLTHTTESCLAAFSLSGSTYESMWCYDDCDITNCSIFICQRRSPAVDEKLQEVCSGRSIQITYVNVLIPH